MKIVYPKLARYDFSFFRLGGPGLANCLFVAARAYLHARRTGAKLLRPTWERIGVGQCIRRERDKRCYRRLFKHEGFWRTFYKMIIVLLGYNVEVVDGLGKYFEDILQDQHLIASWLISELEPSAIANVPETLRSCVAVHIRLGDYQPPYLTPVSWYVEVIRSLRSKLKCEKEILVFSDGNDRELEPVLTLPGVRRAFFGNACADILAISRCCFLIGSDSTFSGWGAFLGQVPCVFPHLHYCQNVGMLKDRSKMMVLGDTIDFPDEFLPLLTTGAYS